LCATYRKVFNDVVKDDKKMKLMVIFHIYSIPNPGNRPPIFPLSSLRVFDLRSGAEQQNIDSPSFG
jgi:hypothetical protein